MTAQAKAGKRSDSGFKKEAWNEVTLAFNNKLKPVLTKQQIKTRVQTLKGKYTAVKAMLSASGFGWDEARQVILVHDSVWEDYIEHHPKVADYRNTPMPLYKQLGELFDGTFATAAIENIAEEMRNRTAKLRVLSPSQKAIKILQKYYADDLPTSSLVQAFDVMIDEKKASLFVVMEPGSARDAWLLKQLQD
ncbi:hypothetical protein PHYBOEH_009793 [Phytophthora boehmeriae]|uniref:Myb/SANT-like domain-containing protein n=1 Tax=Phytophthora boehmeriae TaxID=109152 RepID=A0A8T1VUU9_9STRA|nr:hypothetical protein PHYBOEH_009793 [Phytophthora boehmeriae]